jgi:hypothetical protein
MAPGEAIVALGFFASLSAIFVLRGPLGRAIADRIAGRAGTPVDAARALEQLDEVQHRLAELEERQDFTERVLSQERERGKLPARE